MGTTEFAEDYQFTRGPKKVRRLEVPVIDQDRKDRDVPAVHADQTTAYAHCEDEDAGDWVGVLAMTKGETGLFVTYDSDELRAKAAGLISMADYIDARKREVQ